MLERELENLRSGPNNPESSAKQKEIRVFLEGVRIFSFASHIINSNIHIPYKKI